MGLKKRIIILQILFGMLLILLGLSKTFEPRLYERYFFNLILSMTVIAVFTLIYFKIIEKKKGQILWGLLIGICTGLAIGLILPYSIILSYYPDQEFIGLYFIRFALITLIAEALFWFIIGIIIKNGKNCGETQGKIRPFVVSGS